MDGGVNRAGVDDSKCSIVEDEAKDVAEDAAEDWSEDTAEGADDVGKDASVAVDCAEDGVSVA